MTHPPSIPTFHVNPSLPQTPIGERLSGIGRHLGTETARFHPLRHYVTAARDRHFRQLLQANEVPVEGRVSRPGDASVPMRDEPSSKPTGSRWLSNGTAI